MKGASANLQEATSVHRLRQRFSDPTTGPIALPTFVDPLAAVTRRATPAGPRVRKVLQEALVFNDPAEGLVQ